MNKALFLDRDGTINCDYGYVYKVNEFHFITGIFDLCKKAQNLNYKIIVVTNQSGIERGKFTEEDVNILHNYMKEEFKRKGIDVTDVFICPFIDNMHVDRKPNPGMLLKAKEKYNLDMSKSIMIGDNERDIEAGINAGCGKTYLFSQNLEQYTKANKIYNDLNELKEVL